MRGGGPVGWILCLWTAACAAAPAPEPEPAELLAPEGQCAGEADTNGSLEAHRDAVRCLVNHARSTFGLSPLKRHDLLERAATQKTDDLVACNAFSHEACGREPSYWAKELGYTDAAAWSFAENLGLGTGPLGAPRPIVRGWLESPGHRANILTPDFEHLGVGRELTATIADPDTGDSVEDAWVWVLQLGRRTAR